MLGHETELPLSSELFTDNLNNSDDNEISASWHSVTTETVTKLRISAQVEFEVYLDNHKAAVGLDTMKFWRENEILFP